MEPTVARRLPPGALALRRPQVRPVWRLRRSMLWPGVRFGLASFPAGPCFAVPWVTSCGQDRYKPLAAKGASEDLSGGGGRMLRRRGGSWTKKHQPAPVNPAFPGTLY